MIDTIYGQKAGFEMLRRKIDDFLRKWKNGTDKFPLIVKGARQIGKTSSIKKFAKENYENFIEINFALQKEYRDIFDYGLDVDKIISSISIKNPMLKFIPDKTLIFFDEIQACPNSASSLKSFKIDGRYDCICSGSLMGISYNEIESVSVGYKQDYDMYSMDFEEFLWAKGYSDEHIKTLEDKMISLTPLTNVEFDTFLECFREYMVIGGMPNVVNTFLSNKNYSNTLKLQREIIKGYEEDIIKYAHSIDRGKILNTYRKIPVFLGKENKKFQITKVAKNARTREYIGSVEWLESSGIINKCYCLNTLSLPLGGNYNPDNYKLYFMDTGILTASLDDESQQDLRFNKNFNTYKGALYENVVADMLKKCGYNLYFYRNEKSTLEIDFFIRDANHLVPIEVKASDNPTKSLKLLIDKPEYSEIKYGIKLAQKNIGFNGEYYTFPYFLTFLLKKFMNKLIRTN